MRSWGFNYFGVLGNGPANDEGTRARRSDAARHEPTRSCKGQFEFVGHAVVEWRQRIQPEKGAP